jgi:alpha-1,6-mannosyltransferase
MANYIAKNTISWYILPYLLLLVSLYKLAYNVQNRIDIATIFAFIGLSFVAYLSILYRFNQSAYYRLNFSLAIFSRLIFVAAFPLLSDDIYRFIWDGDLMIHGINPFLYTPKELISQHLDWLNPILLEKMNSLNYYSVYPPINQFAFLISSYLGKGNLLFSTIALRFIILLFDLGNIILIKKLLTYFKKDPKLLFLYALNPLVILEFTGNLHFEVAMIFFTLLGIWYLVKNKWVIAAISLAFAILSKLLPLLFIPLLIRQIGLKKTFYSCLIIALVTIVLFLPFVYNINLASHFFNSLNLYYGKFEFNGSIYQLLKTIGWEILGYNPIAYTSKILLVLSLLGFFMVYLKSKNMFEGIFWIIFVYLIFSAIVHPWYMLILIAITPFLKWRLAIVWSVLVCLSYFTYRIIPYQEELSLLAVAYGLLGLFMIYERYRSHIHKIDG